MHIPNTASATPAICLQHISSDKPMLRSGDNTLEALQAAIDEVDAMHGDGKFVFLLSDANLRRYGISGQTVGVRVIPGVLLFVSGYLIVLLQFSRVLTSKPNVAAFVVFIGSQYTEVRALRIQTDDDSGLGAEAENLKRQLPVGRSVFKVFHRLSKAVSHQMSDLVYAWTHQLFRRLSESCSQQHPG
jgi:hypothetical protein